MKLTTRHLFRGAGLHRKSPATEAGFPPAVGAVVTQAFRNCRGCGEDTPVVLHPGGYHCTAARHITITTGNRS